MGYRDEWMRVGKASLDSEGGIQEQIQPLHLVLGIPPPEAVCPDLLIGFKSMPYVMRYSNFSH